MNWQIIFNPFSKITERKLLFIGTVVAVIVTLLSILFKMKMDALYHFDSAKNLSELEIVLHSLGILTLFTALIWLFALFINRKTRIIDILNSVLIAQIPLILIMVISKIHLIERTIDKFSKMASNKEHLNVSIGDTLIIASYGFTTLLLLVYGFVLLFNGFKTATNLKNWKQTVVFFIYIFIALTLSQILI